MTAADSAVEPSVTVAVLAYGDEPLLGTCIDAVLASTGVRTEVVVVDNGCTTDAVARLAGRAGVVVLEPGHNLGFAGGCNLALREADGEYVALVNGDAVVDPDALAALVRALDDPEVGIATASLRLMDRPETMNSAGNPLHYLGLSWAGALGEPAADHAETDDVASASGAALALRTERWRELGGFWEDMFAYYEDAELSWRCWQRGLRVRFVPDARVRHRYEFSRNPTKVYLLERNRLLLLLTLYERRTLLVLAPAILGLEAAVLAVAAKQGWAGDKVRGWWWIVRHARRVRVRRREVQADRRRVDAELVPLLTDAFSPGAETGLQAPRVLAVGSRLWWLLARRAL